MTNKTTSAIDLVERKFAETIHGAMVHAVREFKGFPQPWRNGNSTAESYARREALAAIEASGIADTITRLQAALEDAVDILSSLGFSTGEHRDAIRKAREALRSSVGGE